MAGNMQEPEDRCPLRSNMHAAHAALIMMASSARKGQLRMLRRALLL